MNFVFDPHLSSVFDLLFYCASPPEQQRSRVAVLRSPLKFWTPPSHDLSVVSSPPHAPTARKQHRRRGGRAASILYFCFFVYFCGRRRSQSSSEFTSVLVGVSSNAKLGRFFLYHPSHLARDSKQASKHAVKLGSSSHAGPRCHDAGCWGSG